MSSSIISRNSLTFNHFFNNALLNDKERVNASLSCCFLLLTILFIMFILSLNISLRINADTSI